MICLQNSKANPAKVEGIWVGLAIKSQTGPTILIFKIFLGQDNSFEVKNVDTHAQEFSSIIIWTTAIEVHVALPKRPINQFSKADNRRYELTVFRDERIKDSYKI